MTDKHQLKADSESLNSSDIQGTTVAETLESALSKLSLDKASNSSVAPPDQDDASSELASQGARANGFSTLQTTSVVLQQPSEHTKEQKVEKDGDSAQSNPATASENELSPKDLALKKLGLKATHRPGFYLYEDNPQRMRIQTSTHAFDLDRRCPHAKADMLKWGVLRQNNTLVCGVHYWRFNLEDEGKCIAHPEETLNACPVERCIDW